MQAVKKMILFGQNVLCATHDGMTGELDGGCGRRPTATTIYTHTHTQQAARVLSGRISFERGTHGLDSK